VEDHDLLARERALYIRQLSLSLRQIVEALSSLDEVERVSLFGPYARGRADLFTDLEAHFGVLKRFTLANTDDPSHRVRRQRVYRYLRYRHRTLGRLHHSLTRIRSIS